MPRRSDQIDLDALALILVVPRKSRCRYFNELSKILKMINQAVSLILVVEERGGLFDFGATLPLMAVQFLALMFILNLILYNPLITLINKRNEYIVSNLSQASDLLTEANQLTMAYESDLASTKKQAQQKVMLAQRAQKLAFDDELVKSQRKVESLLQKVLSNFEQKKILMLDGLNSEINSLSEAIYKELFTVT